MLPGDYLKQILDAPVSRTVLDNGLTVVFQQTQGPKVASAQLWVKTGSIHEGARLGCGLSHALEHMVFKRAGGRDAAEISRAMQSVGGLLNAYTTFDRTVYHADLPVEGLSTGLGILADLAFRPEFTQADWGLERSVILRELSMTQDDPDDRRGRLLMESVFRKHPYRHPVIGHLPLFESLTFEDLWQYHAQRYAPNNAILVLTGSLPLSAALKQIQRAFGKIRMGAITPAPVEEEPPQLSLRTGRVYDDVHLTRGGAAYAVPGLGHPHAPALAALASLAGVGMSSVLWQALRQKKGWVHDIEASLWSPGNRGLLGISYSCEAARRAKVETAIRELLENFSEKDIHEAALAKIVRTAQMGEINARRSASTLASRLGTAEVTIGDIGFSREYFKRLANLTPTDVLAAAQTHLTGRNLSLVSVEPRSAARATRAQKTSARGLPAFSQITLPNGVRLLLQPQTGYPKIHFKTASLGGSLFEANGLYGATALGATLLARDTRTRTAAEIATHAESLGIYFSEYAGTNSFGLAAECLPCDLDATVRLLGEALTESAFLPQTFALERKGQLDDLHGRDDEITEFGRYRLRADFFKEHPYAMENLGAPADLRGLTAEKVHAHMTRLLCAKNLVVAVSGDFHPAQLVKKLRPWLNRLPAKKFSLPRKAFAGPQPSSRTIKMPFEQALLMDAYPDCGVRGKNFMAFELLDEIVGGLSSRLYRRVREDNALAYFIGSERVLGLDTGMFVFFAGTAPEHISHVQSEISAEIARLRDGAFEEGELDRCKARLKAGRRMALQTPASRTGNASLNALYGQDPNDWQTYDARIEALTADQVASAARRSFCTKNRVALIVQPR